MDVFISWSGHRSGAVAHVLRKWLPLMVNAINPWLSSEDIDKGSRWATDIASRLGTAKAGIICLTPSNVNSPWILFEAGAISRTMTSAYVCTLLIGLEPSDVKGPLAQFQATNTKREEIWKLVGTLNKALGKLALDGRQLQQAFEALWPNLESELRNIPADESSPLPKRSERDLLTEILDLLRSQRRGLAISSEDWKELVSLKVKQAIDGEAKIFATGYEFRNDSLEFVLDFADGRNTSWPLYIPTDTPPGRVAELVKEYFLEFPPKGGPAEQI